MRNFVKFTVSFWKIYHEKKQILENLSFYGNISMEIGIMGKFLWIYEAGKNCSNIQGSWWSRG
jgi:hypothetical protein